MSHICDIDSKSINQEKPTSRKMKGVPTFGKKFMLMLKGGGGGKP